MICPTCSNPQNAYNPNTKYENYIRNLMHQVTMKPWTQVESNDYFTIYLEVNFR